MKNVHLIPTHKPSKLYRTGAFILLDSKAMPHDTIETINQHIYITNDEKPKAGDWSLYQYKIHKCIEDIIGDEFKKIILTTDQDLIDNGVQDIDTEFLEWFVKNPSCEYVTVYDGLFENRIWKKYIIIPKEKQKQHLIDIMKKTPMTFVPDEKMYSEEDMIAFMRFIISQESLGNTSSVSVTTAKYYLEQFKKK